MKIFKKIKQQIKENSILIYMKGTIKIPRCGFSARAVEILLSYQKPFTYIDVLKEEDIRIFLPKYSNWPTFPQIWIMGKLIGGCDIISEMHNSGELKNLILNIS